MGCLDKVLPVIGGGLGFLVGGPAGAAIGAGIGGSIGGANIAGEAAEQAAATQAAGIDRATEIQLQLAEQRREDFAPFQELGTGKIQDLLNIVSGTADIQETPGFRFRQEESQRAIDRAAAAGGHFGSSGALTTLAREASRTAGEEQERQFGRLLDLVNIGRGATTTAGAQAGQSATNLANLATGRGQTVAGGQLAAGEQRASTFSNLGALPLQALTAFPNLLNQPTGAVNPFITGSNPLGLTQGQGL